jgi:hypothetical protein
LLELKAQTFFHDGHIWRWQKDMQILQVSSHQFKLKEDDRNPCILRRSFLASKSQFVSYFDQGFRRGLVGIPEGVLWTW